jgi:hypothetical protein
MIDHIIAVVLHAEHTQAQPLCVQYTEDPDNLAAALERYRDCVSSYGRRTAFRK